MHGAEDEDPRRKMRWQAGRTAQSRRDRAEREIRNGETPEPLGD